ncbi:MAG: glycosyltransferase [Desulfuromonadales bacterium]|nr:glycosyltransferase [Desulfuromonadales bacterium]
MALQVSILHIFGRMVRGGAEMRTLEIMRYMDRSRFRFCFVALSGLPGELDEEIRSLGGEVFHLQLRSACFPWRFKELIRREKITAVHSHVHLFSGFLLALARSEKVPVRIAHFRSMRDGTRTGIRRRCQNQLMRYWTDQHATNILAVCEGAMATAWDPTWRGDPRCEVIYNGLDLAPFGKPQDREGVRREFGLSPSSRLCIHVGRMVEAKNHPRLIAIFRHLSREIDDSVLLLVGRGERGPEDRLRQMVREFGLGERVIFAGERTDVPRLLKASDLLLFPSLWEGLPGIILECCAAGLPALATDLPGIREIQAWFPDLVEVLSLQSADEGWAAAAAALLQSPKPRAYSVPDLFQGTPFRLEVAGERLSRIWVNR